MILGCAIADIKYVSNAFLYFYDPRNNDFEEFSFINPLAVGTKLSRSPHEGKSYFKKGKNTFEIIPLGASERELKVQLKGAQQVHLKLSKNKENTPLRVCTKTGATGWTYTEKSNGLNVRGSVFGKALIEKLKAQSSWHPRY